MKARIVTATVAAAALGLAAAGCGESDSEPATATADKPSRASVGKGVISVEGKYADKTTKVSGIVFEAKRGLVLTANHAVEGATDVDVTLADGTVAHGIAVARAQCHDMAVLRLSPKPTELTAIPLADSRAAAIGQPVATMAFQFDSGGRKPALSEVQGTISGTNVSAEFSPLPATGPFIAHQTALVSGAAGSPLLDAKGRMIGLNTFVGHPRKPDQPGTEYALTSSYIRGRLRELRPGKGGALGGWEAEHNTCHGRLLKLIGKGHVHDPGAPTPKS
jgi:S1-C subfamily serine protease